MKKRGSQRNIPNISANYSFSPQGNIKETLFKHLLCFEQDKQNVLTILYRMIKCIKCNIQPF